LEGTNKRLEGELATMRDTLKAVQDLQFKDNVEHFVRIQELFNKVQIENKQLHSTNKKLESKLDAKERLVKHLEDKVTKDLIDKEDVIVKLKSDIVLLKGTVQ
jgi:DNA-binding protein H-NS